MPTLFDQKEMHPDRRRKKKKTKKMKKEEEKEGNKYQSI